MHTANAQVIVPRNAGLGWRSLTLIVLLAFVLQSYAVQTHIHGVAQANNVSRIAETGSNVPAHNRSPAQSDLTQCPFCQAMVNAGAFLTPATLDLLLPARQMEMQVASAITNRDGRTPAHGWRSRAPPSQH